MEMIIYRLLIEYSCAHISKSNLQSNKLLGLVGHIHTGTLPIYTAYMRVCSKLFCFTGNKSHGNEKPQTNR